MRCSAFFTTLVTGFAFSSSILAEECFVFLVPVDKQLPLVEEQGPNIPGDVVTFNNGLGYPFMVKLGPGCHGKLAAGSVPYHHYVQMTEETERIGVNRIYPPRLKSKKKNRFIFW